MKDLSEFLKSDQSYYTTNADLLVIMIDMGTYFTALPRDHTLLNHRDARNHLYSFQNCVWDILRGNEQHDK